MIAQNKKKLKEGENRKTETRTKMKMPSKISKGGGDLSVTAGWEEKESKSVSARPI